MKLKNTIFNDEFKKVIQKLMEQDMPLKKTFQLKKIIQEIDRNLKIYDEMKIKIFEKYGEKDESGRIVVNTDFLNPEKSKNMSSKEINSQKENYEKFLGELKELNEIENEYNFEPLELPEDIKISTKDLIIIEIILKD